MIINVFVYVSNIFCKKSLNNVSFRKLIFVRLGLLRETLTLIIDM